MTSALMAIAEPQFIEFHAEEPLPTAAGGRSWSVRGQNYTLDYVEAGPADLVSYDSVAEHVLIIPDDDGEMTIASSGRQVRVTEAAVVILPPGPTEIRVHRSMRFVHLCDIRDARGVDAALNAAHYEESDPRVADLVVVARNRTLAGPEVFLLSEYPPETGRFGTIFQSETFLVNILDPQQGPRDPDNLSPHHHDDFEQCSLVLDGEWIHHLRTPWGPRRSDWREDQHQTIGSPSVTIIPPPVIHTSEAVGPGLNRLVDIFCPVRDDFVAKGWVLNAADYTTSPR